MIGMKSRLQEQQSVSHRDVSGINESEHTGNGCHGICAVWVLCQLLQTKASFYGYVATLSFQFLSEKNSLRNSLESGPQIG